MRSHLTLCCAIDVGLVKSWWGALAGPLGLPLLHFVNSSYVSSDCDWSINCLCPFTSLPAVLVFDEGLIMSEELKESDDEPSGELPDEDPPDDRYATVSASEES